MKHIQSIRFIKKSIFEAFSWCFRSAINFQVKVLKFFWSIFTMCFKTQKAHFGYAPSINEACFYVLYFDKGCSMLMIVERHCYNFTCKRFSRNSTNCVASVPKASGQARKSRCAPVAFVLRHVETRSLKNAWTSSCSLRDFKVIAYKMNMNKQWVVVFVWPAEQMNNLTWTDEWMVKISMNKWIKVYMNEWLNKWIDTW